ncbi:uncharacterized protein LOC144881490 [Branchiostoma floridae x Branchiostoma japonicum]
MMPSICTDQSRLYNVCCVGACLGHMSGTSKLCVGMVLSLVICALVIAMVYPYMVSHLQHMSGYRSKEMGTTNTLLQYILTRLEGSESENKMIVDMKTVETALPTRSPPLPTATPPPALPHPTNIPNRHHGDRHHVSSKIQKARPIRPHLPIYNYRLKQITKPPQQTKKPCIPPPQDALQASNNSTPRPIKTCPVTTSPLQDDEIVDCDDLYKKGLIEVSGVYSVPENQFSPVLSCGIDNKKGWTIIHRHSKSNQEFCRNWEAYKKGFGIAWTNFWLGNEYTHYMTKTKCYMLQIQMVDSNRITRHAVYDYFALDSESANYTLWLGEYSGNAGDVMGEYSGKEFKTKDKIPQKNSSIELDLCPGGWWSNRLSLLHLKGIQQYHNMGESCGEATWWKTWRATWKSQYDYNVSFPFRSIEMRILPVTSFQALP